MPEVSQHAATIARVDVHDHDAMLACYEVYRAAHTDEDPDDPIPTAPEIIGGAQASDTSSAREFWVLHEGSRVVASYRLDLPLLDNLDLVELDVTVHPDHQRRGLGRTAMTHARDRITALGRHQVIGAVNEPADGSTNRAMRFVAAAGMTRSLGEMRRTLDLRILDHEQLATLGADAEARSAGYRLMSWTGPCPAELVDDYAALVARMSTDAPMGGLDIEPEHWDARRVRELEAILVRQGRVPVVTAARLGADGPLVAFTDIMTTRHDPEAMFQWNTLVLREHRGRRLGMLVKLANLDRLLAEAPRARRLHTWNADENSYMISINEAMGFRPAQRESAWRLDLPR